MESEDAKEIYAHFGRAMYFTNCLEHSIVNALCLLSLLPNREVYSSRKEWENLIDHHYEESFKKCFGALKNQLKSHPDPFPSLLAIIPDLEKCVEERNFLAHRFYREYAQHWFSTKGRKEMVKKLEAASELFNTTDEKLEDALKPITEKYGITEEILQKYYSEMQEEAENY
ncbi:MAG: hypothetical protein JSS50_04000 [Proteobacteria bacterium]|nr:hypothetical protein [Pseudomonadota bacterium]